MKSLDKIRSDPRVDSVSDERSSADGIFVYLKPGYQTMNDPIGHEHAIHEDSIAEVVKQMKWIMECNCPDCKKEDNMGSKNADRINRAKKALQTFLEYENITGRSKRKLHQIPLQDKEDLIVDLITDLFHYANSIPKIAGHRDLCIRASGHFLTEV